MTPAWFLIIRIKSKQKILDAEKVIKQDKLVRKHDSNLGSSSRFLYKRNMDVSMRIGI